MGLTLEPAIRSARATPRRWGHFDFARARSRFCPPHLVSGVGMLIAAEVLEDCFVQVQGIIIPRVGSLISSAALSGLIDGRASNVSLVWRYRSRHGAVLSFSQPR